MFAKRTTTCALTTEKKTLCVWIEKGVRMRKTNGMMMVMMMKKGTTYKSVAIFLL